MVAGTAPMPAAMLTSSYGYMHHPLSSQSGVIPRRHPEQLKLSVSLLSQAKINVSDNTFH